MELGNTPKTDFIKNLVMLNEADEIVIIDKNQSTSCPGLFAQGDVTDTPFKQAITSTWDDAKAGLDAYNYVQDLRRPTVKSDGKMKDHRMVINRHAFAVTLIYAFSISISIIISVALLVSNAYGIAIMDNNSNIKRSSSAASTNASEVNQSSTGMMMKMLERGAISMGFNQNKIVHQFVATPSGGKIIILALNSSDKQTINQIKDHVMDIRKEFSEGNFTKPFFIHAQEVPGTKIMSEKKDLIKYNILEMKNGFSLVLTTNNKVLIDAIRQFVEFQAREHYGH